MATGAIDSAAINCQCHFLAFIRFIKQYGKCGELNVTALHLLLDTIHYLWPFHIFGSPLSLTRAADNRN